MDANTASTPSLDSQQRQRLLELARHSIEEHLVSGQPLHLVAPDAALARKAGCFVTLRASEELRGCIGTFREDLPLVETVRQMAVASATEDPRFPPVQPRELPHLRLEISVLTPRRRVAGANEIEVGRDGIWIERGEQRGVLLPQVATEERWDVTTFLNHTCLKAGLPPDSWKDPETRISIFQAEVFGEGPRRAE